MRNEEWEINGNDNGKRQRQRQTATTTYLELRKAGKQANGYGNGLTAEDAESAENGKRLGFA